MSNSLSVREPHRKNFNPKNLPQKIRLQSRVKIFFGFHFEININFKKRFTKHIARLSFASQLKRRLFQLMQSEMELIDRWLVTNKLSINIEKTKFMLFSTPNSNVGGKHFLSIKNRQIDQVNSKISWCIHLQ